MLCIAIGLFVLGASAQSDSLYVDTIYIQATPFSSSHQVNLSTDSPSHNLAQSIQHTEAVYVKNYGGLSLATISIRGSSASQTGIYWNDLSISNSMLGLLDLSILPSMFMEQSTLIYGSESTHFGSGNIGGGLYLKNRKTAETYLSTSAGSFGNYINTAKLSFGEKVNTSIKVQYQSIRNNYPYSLENGEKKVLENGNGSQLNAMYNTCFSLGENHFSLNYWFTSANRNIPLTTRQSTGDDSTKDINNRININYKRRIARGFIKWNTGYFINNNQFFQTVLINKNINNTLANRLSYELSTANTSFTVGIDQSHISGRSMNYSEQQSQHRIALYSNYSNRNKYLDFDLRFRQELIDNSFAPFIPEINLSKRLGHFRLGVKGNRVYRNPTLNDLFWAPGGNKDLLSETGWAGEFNAQFKLTKNKYKLSSDFTMYSRSVDNWIVWTLNPGSFFFSPRNINKVWSRGIEYGFFISKDYSKIGTIKNRFNYNMNLSTFQVQQEFPRKEVGEQLLYTPVHQIQNSLSYSKNRFSSSFNTRYFSESKGINADLDPYLLGDLHLTYTLPIYKHKLKIQFQVNNIWNKSYRIIEFRPMPGRNYLVSLKIF